VPRLTEQSKADLYALDDMPENLRHAHALNDEVLEHLGRMPNLCSRLLPKCFSPLV